MQSLIVFSHLRWNFVFQRPQHLMTRLAKHYRIFFFEEPICEGEKPQLSISEVLPNVNVCTPYTQVAEPGFHDQQLAMLRALLEELIRDYGISDPVVWLYTPMALPLIADMKPAVLIYDCMDELTGFKGAPRQLLQREHALLKAADLVFTGGPSLYRAKLPLHHAVHCFPSSVDESHFASARDSSIETLAQRDIAHPRLGFFGVIDERLDTELIDRLARERPDWQIIMVGPVVKIAPESLPTRANIHYFGQQAYSELPKFVAGWDVCLLPFALNAATRFISPTKTLEYMAAAKPTVSTPIEDVATPYAGIVGIGSGDQFVSLCEEALRETPAQRVRRKKAMREIVEATSWDKTAGQMYELIETRRAETDRSLRLEERSMQVHETDSEQQVIVIGAGPTGLSAAYHLGENCLLLEQHEAVGGWCRSITDKGFTFDFAGHIMFSNDPYVQKLYTLLLGENVHWQDREAWIYSKAVYTRYPFQGALYGLPPEVISECVMGAIEAQYGRSKVGSPSTRLGSNGSNYHCKAESITDCCADGIAEAEFASLPAEQSKAPVRPPANFEDFIYRVWGRGIAKHFAIPYNQKLWAVPLASMETSWLGGRVPLPDLSEMIEGALRPVAKPMGPNARFGYPLRGGFQALMDGFLPHLRCTLKLNTRVKRIIPSRRLIVLADGSQHRYEEMISTIPLPLLVKMMGNEAPPAVRTAAARLRHVSVRCVNLGIGREGLTTKHWIYYPESTVFHRIFVQGNASPHCNSPGGFALTCEISYSPDKPLPCEGEKLIARCIEDAIKVGLINAEDPILARNMVDMPYAYVIYDHVRAENVALVRKWAQGQNITLSGRYSEWEYYNSDHAFLAGRKAAEAVRASLNASATTAISTPPLSTSELAQAAT